MNEESIPIVEKKTRKSFRPSMALETYSEFFSTMLNIKEQRLEINFLKSLMKKKIFEIEKQKLKEKMKRL